MISRRVLRTKVVKSVYAYLQSGSDDIAAAERTLVSSINKAYELYHLMLTLPQAIAEYAAERIEIGRNKMLPTYEDLHPNTKFAENAAIAKLAQDKGISDFCQQHGLSWANDGDVIKNLYLDLIEQPFYQQYMQSAKHSFREDVQLAEQLMLHLIECDDLIEDTLEEQSIMWADDLDYVITMVARTIAGIGESKDFVKLLPKFKSEDDLDFACKLFRQSIIEYEASVKIIDEYIQNWDLERIALMDNVILCVAIVEAKSFASIPVKVTLNEYIDIAKYYSTPSSSLFINGVLDKITATMLAEGKIVKSGKGLL